MREIGYKMAFSRLVRLSALGVLLCIAFAAMITLLWTVALAAPPIEENPISVQGPTAIPLVSQDIIRAVVAVDLDTDGHSDIAYGQANILRIQRNVGITMTEWAQAVDVSSASENIRDVHAVDLDRDGAMDLVSASADDAGNSELRLWQNPGTPFAGSWPVVNDTLSNPGDSLRTVASADLDGNGAPDLVSGGLDGVLRLWSNPLTDTQVFTTAWPSPATISTPGDQIRQVLIADVDRDGRPDIIEAAGDGSSGAVRLWQNPGSPFTTAWMVNNTLSTFTTTVQSIGLGDLDNDGAPDILAGLANGQVVAWHNPLTSSQPFTTSWGSSSLVGNLSLPIYGLAVTDADHDGYLDVVVTGLGTPSTMAAWRNTGQPFSGGWSQVTIGSITGATLALAAADFNRDGDDDFVTAAGNSGLQLWTNALIRSSARFETPNVSNSVTNALVDVGLHAMDVHDMDRDGLPDIIVATLDGSLILLRNDGTPFSSGTWPATTIGNSSGFFAVTVGDLDGDGWPDIATSTKLADTGSLLHIWRNDGTPFEGAWTSQVAETFPRQAMDLALGDIGHEGHLQIVASTGITTTFENPAERDVPTSDDNRIWLLRPPAGDPFASAWISSTVCTTTYSANSVALGDLDNDGWLDVVFGTDHAPSGTTDWPTTSGWYNGPAYQVRACRSLGNPYSSAGWQAYDVGRDDAPISVQLGHRFWGTHVFSVAVGDFNNDGYPDVVSGGGAEGDYQLLVYKNDGTPFDNIIWEPTAIGYGTSAESGSDCPGVGGTYPEDCPWLESSIAAVNMGDLNGDGWLDVVSGFGGHFTILPIWINSGTPFGNTVTDTHWIRYNLGSDYSLPVYGVEAADLDRDGRLDVTAVTSYRGSAVEGPLRVWRNLGGIARHTSHSYYSLPTIEDGATESMFTFAITHNGRPYDHDLELDFMKISLVDSCSQPMDDAAASALFQSWQIYRDANGDSVWQPTDSLAITLTTFSLDNGYQTLTFPSGDPLAAISPGQTVTYFVVLKMQPMASQASLPGFCNGFRLQYIPHEAFLVKDRGTQTSVSIEEGAQVFTPWSGIAAVPAPAASVTMAAAPSTIWANGTSTLTITATVMTAHGYPVLNGTPITFTTSAGSLPASPYTTTTISGTATAVLTSSTGLTTATVTGTVSITATGTVTVEFGVGPRASLRINDAPGLGGNEVITHTMTTADTFTVYAAAYDSAEHFIDNPTDVTWGGTGVVSGHLSPTIGVSSTTFTPVLAGTGTITVADGSGHADATGTITVTEVGIVGLAATNDSPTPLGSATTLTATITGGSNVTYTWAFGDGGSGSGAVVTHIYPSVGVYTAVVTASNSVSVFTTTTTVTIVGLPDLVISKSGPSTAQVADYITYTLTITNSSDADATGLVITDTLPAGASYVSGGALTGDEVRWAEPLLAAGDSIQVSFVVTASEAITLSNSDYRVAADGSVSAVGQEEVVTVVHPASSETNKIYLPIVIKSVTAP